MGHDVREHGDGREDADHLVLGERSRHPLDRRGAVGAPDDELGQQRVVEARDRVALVGGGVVAHPGTGRRAQPGDGPGRRQPVGKRILGVDAALDRRAPKVDVGLRVAERLAGGDPELLAHEIDAGDHLGHRVLDLEPRVHLEEIEAAVSVHEELDRPGVDVAGRLRDPAGGLAHALAHRAVHARRGRFLDELLVPALDRALALAQMDDAPVGIGQHLHFHVPGLGQAALEVDGAVAERPRRFAPREAERGLELRLGADKPYALAASAHRGLDEERIADLARRRAQGGVLGQRLEGPGHRRHVQLAGNLPRRGLGAHRADRLRRRSDEHEPGGGAGLGERGVLGEEPVARVYGVGAASLGDAHELVDRQIALGRRGRADRVRLVGHEDVERLAVDLGEHGHRRDPLLATGADHTHCDLASIRHEDLRDLHRGQSSRLEKKYGISTPAVSGESEPWTALASMDDAKSLRIVPAAALTGSVAPMSSRHR